MEYDNSIPLLSPLTVQSHIYTRSKIAVRDLGSKYGTRVDGNTVKDESKDLTGEEHEIKLGRYEHALR